MGWFLISIVLPLAAPICALLFLRPLPLPPQVRASIRMMTLLKDGQLCWVAIGFCASALYEIGVSNPCSFRLPTGMLDYLTGVAIFMIVGSSLLAAGGAMFPTSALRPEGISWRKHYSCFTYSVGLSVCAASIYAMVHFGFTPHFRNEEALCLNVG
jgi:hypothetical protein